MTWNNIRRNRFSIVIFAFLLLVSLVVLIQKRKNERLIRAKFGSSKSTIPPAIFSGIKDLKEKLLALELDNSVRTQKLLKLQRKMKDSFASNLTEGRSLSLPSIYNSLPHLLGHKDALTPQLSISQGRGNVTLSFGIPTVRRQKKSYLKETLSSMINGLGTSDRKDVIIIVFIGEVNPNHIKEIVDMLKKNFMDSINSGLLEVISPPRNYYPNLENLPSTFNDPTERVKWRAKQNLDYAFLMMYAQSKSIFYVQMEDDIIATPSYASTIKSFALQQASNNWLMLEFSTLGFIGKLFHSSDLSILVNFFLMFYKEKPNDWLLDHIFWVKVCNPEKDNKHCNREKQKLRIRFKPSLFQHVGKLSSLPGKKQTLIDKEFKKQPLFQAHLNPKATIKSNFNEYQTFTAQRGYLGHSFLWALTPQKDAVLRMHFDKPQIVEKILFRSGNIEHPGDKLINATVEVLTEAKHHARELNSHKSTGISSPYLDEDFVTVCQFSPGGVAEGNVPTKLGKITEIRIRVLYDVKDNWVIISEFNIVTGKK